jgi:CheY-like chemotaxis protein
MSSTGRLQDGNDPFYNGLRGRQACEMSGMEYARLGSTLIAFSPQPSVADFLRRLLAGAGFNVCLATSTTEELEALVTMNRPDAVVYDIGFPFTDNWHVLQRLRGSGALARTTVVITTSDARELYRRVGVTAALELFRRPDDLAELRNVVLAAIDAAAPVHAA